MDNTSAHKAAIQNPALSQLSVLVGKWKTVGSHPYLPGVVLHGRTSFDWIEGGAFLVMHSENDEDKIPSGIAIIGSDDAMGDLFMLYFDERQVSRKYDVSFQGNVLQWWRNDPAFSQRYSLTITDSGNTLVGQGEMSKGSAAWEKDLELRYTRIR